MQTYEVELVFIDGYKIEVVVYADDDNDAVTLATATASKPQEDIVSSLLILHWKRNRYA